jgi:hypothetical protein
MLPGEGRPWRGILPVEGVRAGKNGRGVRSCGLLRWNKLAVVLIVVTRLLVPGRLFFKPTVVVPATAPLTPCLDCFIFRTGRSSETGQADLWCLGIDGELAKYFLNLGDAPQDLVVLAVDVTALKLAFGCGLQLAPAI